MQAAKIPACRAISKKIMTYELNIPPYRATSKKIMTYKLKIVVLLL